MYKNDADVRDQNLSNTNRSYEDETNPNASWQLHHHLPDPLTSKDADLHSAAVQRRGRRNYGEY